MIRLLQTFILLTILTSCIRTNVLTYKHRQYFKERSIITSDSIFELYQDAYYNVPHIIDEEFAYYLTLKFLDTTVAKTKKILNLMTDTLIVKSNYGVFSVWNWSDEKNKIGGQIEIINWDKDSIIIKENVSVYDIRRKERKKFHGTRTFTRQVGW